MRLENSIEPIKFIKKNILVVLVLSSTLQIIYRFSNNIKFFYKNLLVNNYSLIAFIFFTFLKIFL